MRFAFIPDDRGDLPAPYLCPTIGVSPRGYRAFGNRPLGQKRHGGARVRPGIPAPPWHHEDDTPGMIAIERHRTTHVAVVSEAQTQGTLVPAPSNPPDPPGAIRSRSLGRARGRVPAFGIGGRGSYVAVLGGSGAQSHLCHAAKPAAAMQARRTARMRLRGCAHRSAGSGKGAVQITNRVFAGNRAPERRVTEPAPDPGASRGSAPLREVIQGIACSDGVKQVQTPA